MDRLRGNHAARILRATLMATTTQFRLSRIGQISVTVHNLERAIDFYRDTLGMKHLFTVPHLAFFDCAGIRLMLAIPEKPEFDYPSSIVYFKVDDIHAAYDTLVSRGARFEGKPRLIAPMPSHDLGMAFFRDSENNLLSLMCEAPKKTPGAPAV